MIQIYSGVDQHTAAAGTAEKTPASCVLFPNLSSAQREKKLACNVLHDGKVVHVGDRSSAAFTTFPGLLRCLGAEALPHAMQYMRHLQLAHQNDAVVEGPALQPQPLHAGPDGGRESAAAALHWGDFHGL